jgi:hypothetical protein
MKKIMKKQKAQRGACREVANERLQGGTRNGQRLMRQEKENAKARLRGRTCLRNNQPISQTRHNEKLRNFENAPVRYL